MLDGPHVSSRTREVLAPTLSCSSLAPCRPEITARKLIKIANSVEAVQDGRHRRTVFRLHALLGHSMELWSSLINLLPARVPGGPRAFPHAALKSTHNEGTKVVVAQVASGRPSMIEFNIIHVTEASTDSRLTVLLCPERRIRVLCRIFSGLIV